MYKVNQKKSVFLSLLMFSNLALAESRSQEDVFSRDAATFCSQNLANLSCYRDIIKESINEEARLQNLDPRALGPYKKNVLKMQGQQIVVDTFDSKTCEEVKAYVLQSQSHRASQSVDIEQLCDVNQKTPDGGRYKTITLLGERIEETSVPIDLSLLITSKKSLLTDTRNLAYMMVATMGILWVGPESLSKWDKKQINERGFFDKWKANVSSPPVIDKDDFVVNYVGHPVSGAIYYTVARAQGYSKMQSLGFSAAMSTFFWEYGFEAVAERPSIQDLIVTPLVGSAMGEVFYQWSNKIKENNGKAFGSQKAGSAMMFFLNPADALSNRINGVLNHKIIQGATSEVVIQKRTDRLTGTTGGLIGIRFNFGF